MLDMMFRERSDEEDEISRLNNELEESREASRRAISSQQARIRELEEKLKHTNSTVVKNTVNQIDTKFLEEGLYAQLLFMVGRTKDAKKFAEEWIASYEINNKLREPTKEEQKAIDKDKEEFYKKVKEIFPNAKTHEEWEEYNKKKWKGEL